MNTRSQTVYKVQKQKVAVIDLTVNDFEMKKNYTS